MRESMLLLSTEILWRRVVEPPSCSGENNKLLRQWHEPEVMLHEAGGNKNQLRIDVRTASAHACVWMREQMRAQMCAHICAGYIVHRTLLFRVYSENTANKLR